MKYAFPFCEKVIKNSEDFASKTILHEIQENSRKNPLFASEKRHF